MPIPMPTVIAKGPTALRLDLRYRDPDRRWRSLKALRATFTVGGTSATGVDVGQNETTVLPPAEANHLRNEWFGQANHWAALKEATGPISWLFGDDNLTEYSLSLTQVQDGERVVTQGLIEALEVSLGITAGESPQLAAENPDKVDADKLKRNLPVHVYWVCGKFDGFEVQVCWTDRQVDVFIVTPPVANAVENLTIPWDDARRDTAKHTDAEGMLLVTRQTGVITSRLMDKGDGGVT